MRGYGQISAGDLLSSLQLAFKLSNASSSSGESLSFAGGKRASGGSLSTKRAFRSTVAAVRILPNAESPKADGGEGAERPVPGELRLAELE